MSSKRRASLSWLLSLLLVFAQHGAVLHQLGHLIHGEHGNGAGAAAQVQPVDSTACATCEAFAQIVNPIAAASGHVAACPAPALASPDPCYAIVSTAPPTPRSRGPPQV